uniref:Zinc finger E-box-binding homeobox 1 n=1 Tax=Cacopsylla melanoneura TaxID=428564 RepID=A0A8D8ZK23_9HEMI
MFNCARCSQSFTRKTYLRKHLLNGDFNKSLHYDCDKCSESFVYKIQLKTHLLTHESSVPLDIEKKTRKLQEVLFKCERCGLKFSSPEHLEVHYNGYHDLFVLLPSI